MHIVIASHNMHKIREIRSILKTLYTGDLLSLADFPHYTPPPETGLSFEDNAILKAVHAAQTLQAWVLADDSGLVVPSLKGAPGIRSARYAGEQATDAENRKKLLEAMCTFTEDARAAYYECHVALASPEGLKKCVRGTSEGILLTQERGGGGFGYDPLFLKHEYSKTFSEMPETLKNRISHRRKALDKISIFFPSL